MKRLIPMMCAILFLFALSDCSLPVEIEREPVDFRYTEAHYGVDTDYSYKYDIFNGKFCYMPEVKTVHYDEKYEIQYRVVYDNGNSYLVWKTVTEEEYKAVFSECAEMIEDGE